MAAVPPHATGHAEVTPYLTLRDARSTFDFYVSADGAQGRMAAMFQSGR